jgi:hypothetical protein
MSEYNTSDYMDNETPGLINDKFNKKVKKQYIKDTIPNTKPKEIFGKNFKEPKKTKKVNKKKGK